MHARNWRWPEKSSSMSGGFCVSLANTRLSFESAESELNGWSDDLRKTWSWMNDGTTAAQVSGTSIFGIWKTSCPFLGSNGSRRQLCNGTGSLLFAGVIAPMFACRGGHIHHGVHGFFGRSIVFFLRNSAVLDIRRHIRFGFRFRV